MEKSFSFVEGTSRVMVDGIVREVTYNSDWEPFHPEGFSWRTIQYENTDKTKEDGAIVRVRPGGRISVEMNVQSKQMPDEHTFWEVHLSGKAKLLLQRLGGAPQVLAFGYGDDNQPYTARIEQGTIFCIFADLDQDADVFYFESEIPGYIEDALPHVDIGVKEFGGYKISEKFWREFQKFDSGFQFNPYGTKIVTSPSPISHK